LFFSQPASSSENKKIILHFKTDDYHISDTDKKKIYNFLKDIKLGQKIRLTVTGHADSTGSIKHNYALSKKRAAFVKKNIFSLFPINPETVAIIAKGSDTPVADNKTASGRAQNRRAEIALEIISGGKKPESYKINKEKIMQLITEAKKLAMLEKFDDALKLLWEAKFLGGKKFSEWHLVYGITGFYGGAKPDDLIFVFENALKIDPYNTEARDFLGRVKARANFSSGVITDKSGLSVDYPIKVETLSQIYEYLNLFEVEAVKHFYSKKNRVDIWNCVTKNRQLINYYFDRSEVLKWAYIK